MDANKNWYRQQPLVQVIVTSQVRVIEGVYLTGFERKFNFEPGQLLLVTTNPDIPGRMYSIASGKEEDELRILYDVKEEGVLTPLLSRLKPGAQLWISAPFGTFRDTTSPAVWIATGTGIAPFLSMTLSGAQPDKLLIHGSRTMEGFYMAAAFQAILGSSYIRCCTTGSGEGIFQGRVTDYLKQVPVLQSEGFYYLCGRAEMVVDVRQILMNRGIPFHRIMSEIYF